MMNGDNTEKICALAYFVRDEVTQAVQVITAEVGETTRSHQEQIEFEQRVRFWLENQLIPSVLAVACGVYDFNSNVVNQEMPELIKSYLSTLPMEDDAKFITDMSQAVDPERWDLISANLGLGPNSEPIAVETFNSALHAIFPS